MQRKTARGLHGRFAGTAPTGFLISLRDPADLFASLAICGSSPTLFSVIFQCVLLGVGQFKLPDMQGWLQPCQRRRENPMGPSCASLRFAKGPTEISTTPGGCNRCHL